MEFNLSDEQNALVDMARSFSEKEIAPFAAEWDANKTFPIETIKKAGANGFCGIYTREDVGGLGMKRLDAALIFEELAAGCPSTTAYITIHNMVVWMIDSFGQEAIRKEFCPKLTSGEMLGSYCLSEPNAGSDAGSLTTRAEKKGNKYIINGTKAWVSGGGSTDVLVVMVRTGGEGPKGISAFVVPTTAKGISYGENEKKMGWNSQPTRIINFDNVEIPESHMLGALGEGFKIAMKGLDGGRINIGTCSVGAAQCALNKAVEHMKVRKQFGKTLSEFQALQFKVADMQTDLIAARQMIRLAAFKLDSKDPLATSYCAMAKRFATDVGFDVCNEALQLFGGYGYTHEYPIEKLMRDSRVHQILEGTNEIMRVIISRKIFDSPDLSIFH